MSNEPRSDPLKVLIVGSGIIAGGIDEKRGQAPPVTHAGAYRAHPGFRLAACVEPDKERRLAFMGYWGVERGFDTLDECLVSGDAFDVVSLCSPSRSHATALLRLLEMPLKVVFAEKPLTTDLADARRVVAAYEAKGRPLAVNFTRRWNPTVAELRRELADGAWGRLRAATGFYTKGILNNGSHLVDLLHFLVGPLTVVRVLRRRADDDPEDPTVDAVLETDHGARLYLIGGDARDYALFELSLVLERGVVSLEDTGYTLRRRRAVRSGVVPGQRELGSTDAVETRWAEQFERAVDELYAVAVDGVVPTSNGATALRAQEVCTEIQRLALYGPEGTL